MAESKTDQASLAPSRKGTAKATVQMNMRVTEEVRDLLVEASNHEGVSMRDAMEAAIRAYHKKKVR